MNLIKEEILSLLPTFTWKDFTRHGEVYVHKMILKFENQEDRERYLRLRDKYPSDFAAALAEKLPEGATFNHFDHLSLRLIVNKA